MKHRLTGGSWGGYRNTVVETRLEDDTVVVETGIALVDGAIVITQDTFSNTLAFKDWGGVLVEESEEIQDVLDDLLDGLSLITEVDPGDYGYSAGEDGRSIDVEHYGEDGEIDKRYVIRLSVEEV